MEQAFDLAVQAFAAIFRQRLSVDTLEWVSRRNGAAAGAYLDSFPPPPPQEEGELLVLTADGKGVPLVTADAVKVKSFEDRPQRPGNRRMATLAGVYSADRYVRTPEEIVEALFRDERERSEPGEPRPRPCHKRVVARLPQVVAETGETEPISGALLALTWAAREVEKRRRPGQPLLRLMDGQHSLWETTAVCGHFDVHTERMHYDAYLAAGYPIATGVIEVACRHLVKDRLERSGMRWTLEGSQALLNLRALRQSSYWNEFHAHRTYAHPATETLTGYRGSPVAPFDLCCNAVAKMASSVGTLPVVASAELVAAVRYQERQLAAEILNSYSHIFPGIQKIVRALHRCPVVFEARHLDKWAHSTASEWPSGDYSPFRFREVIAELGIVGRVRERRTARNGVLFVEADFEYTIEDRLHVSDYEECVIHSMFFDKLRVQPCPGTIVYPFPDHPEFERIRNQT